MLRESLKEREWEREKTVRVREDLLIESNHKEQNLQKIEMINVLKLDKSRENLLMG